MANSSVTIDIIANTKPAEKDIKDLKSNIKSEKDEFVLDDVIDKSYEKQIQQVALLAQKYQQLEAIKKQALQYMEEKSLVDRGGLKPEILEVDRNKISEMGLRYQQINDKISQMNTGTQEVVQGTAKQIDNEKQLGNEIDKNKGKQQMLNNETRGHSFSLNDILKKVIRWGLAIIGVRSAYMGIRRAMSMVSSRSKEVKEKMEQMGNVVAYALYPLVKAIVNLLMKAMVYINYITYALFKKNIFDFSKATKFSSDNLKSGAKSAKEINKQLAGFDEMTILQDNKSSNSDAGGSGGGYSNDWFKDFENIKIPGWVKTLTEWLLKIKDAIVNLIDWFKQLDPVAQKVLGIAGIGGLLLGKGLLSGTGGAGLLGILGKTTLAIGTLEGAYWIANDALTALGLSTGTTGDLVTDLYNVTKDYFELQKQQKDVQKGQKEVADKSVKSFDKLKKQLIENKKAGKEMNKEDYQTLRNLQDRIMYLGKLENPTKEQKEELKKLKDIYGDLYREGVLNNTQMEFYRVITGQTKVAVWDYSIVLDNLIDQQNEEWKASQNQADANEQVAQSTKDGKYWADQYGVTLETIGKKAGLSAEQTDELRDALNKYDNSDKGPRALLELQDTIAKVGKKAGLSKEEIEKLQKNISNMKSKDIKVDVKTPSTTELKNIGVKIGKAINSGFDSVVDLALNVTGNKKGNRKGALIKYAKGGIINQPGRGVPIHIGGEAGREGIVPLTDSQQMALLGEAIGKYITINANITNSMNGRIISRELQKIQNEENFASNRW